MPVNFNVQGFIRELVRILRKERITYAYTDTLNNLIFSKRKELDPQFVIPMAHINRWQDIAESSSSDSAQSEKDSDDENISFQEQESWVNAVLQHLTALFGAYNDTQRRAFARQVADILHMSVKKRSKLGIL